MYLHAGVWKASKRFGPFPKLAGLFSSKGSSIISSHQRLTVISPPQLPGSSDLLWVKHLMVQPAGANFRSWALGMDQDLDPGLPEDLLVGLDTGGERGEFQAVTVWSW